MTASELFHAGRLQEAIDAQVAIVKASPTDNAARLFLFELFLFSGDLDRARKQLDVLRYDDPRHDAAIQQYRTALEAEKHRRAVFAGTEEPKTMLDAPDHVRIRLDALKLLSQGDHAGSRKKLDEANSQVPAASGTLNGKPFESLSDADEWLGTVIEVFGVGGTYAWTTLEQIESITMNPVQSPRDLVYRPVHLVLRDGPEGDVLLPGLYPGSHEQTEEALKLGRATEWVPAGGDLTRGAGGKVFLANEEVIPFVSWHNLVVAEPKTETSPTAPDGPVE